MRLPVPEPILVLGFDGPTTSTDFGGVEHDSIPAYLRLPINDIVDLDAPQSGVTCTAPH